MIDQGNAWEIGMRENVRERDAENERLRGLLKKAYPYIGCPASVDDLIAEIYAELYPSPNSNTPNGETEQ